MATEIKFECLYQTHAEGPVCNLLRINNFTFLLDCGWDDSYDVQLLEPLKQVADSIDAVLISHPDPQHLGALPYLVGRLNLQAAIYGTLPVHKMGQMFMYDQFLSRQQSSDFDTFTLDDVDTAFQRMSQLRFQQEVRLTGKGAGMTVTAYAAGHMVGGAVWRICTPDEEQVVYAMHWNHRKDRHLNGALLDSAFSRPAVLITDAVNALAPPVNTQRRDADFLAAVMATLRADGNVLIPTDTAGRALELVLLLERHWQQHRLSYPLALLTPVAYSTLEFAKSQLEWMNNEIGAAFERSRANPFECRYLKVVQNKEKLWELPQGPRVVLASVASLAAGMSLQLLVDWAPNPANLIIFPGKAPEGSIAATLQAKPAGGEPLQLQMQLGRRVPLEGEELRRWQESQRAQLVDAGPAAPPDLQPVVSELASRGSFGAQALSSRTSAGLHSADSMKSTQEVLVDGFTVPEGAAAPMFPFDEEEQERDWSDYGAVLRPGEFRLLQGVDDMAEVEKEEEEEEEEVPSRVVTSDVVVNVRAQVLRFDFEGLSDGHSMRTILAHIAPRHLVIAHGSPQAVAALRLACVEQEEIKWQVHVATVGQVVDVSPGSSSYRVLLSDALLQGLKLRPMGKYQLAWVDAVMASDAEADEQMELLPASKSDTVREGGIFIGNVRLSDLKKALGKAGISADFYAGMLVCQGRVTIKSIGSGGELVLEGALSQDYYRIRDVVYGQYHIC